MRLMGKYATFLVTIALFLVPAVSFSTERVEFGADVVCGEEINQNSLTFPTLQNISIYYENNCANPRWNYSDNAKAYKAIVEAVKRLALEQNGYTVIIEGAASPVGSETYNFRLALRRAEILRDIISRMEGGDKLKIRTISAGEDWTTFQSYIESNYYAANREEVLEILRTTETNDAKERMLYNIDKGKTWRVLVRDFMDSARNAAMIHIVGTDDLISKSPSLNFQSDVTPIKLDMLMFMGKPSVLQEPIEIVKPVAISIDKLKIEPQEQPQEQPTLQAQTTTPRKPVVAVRSNLLVPALNVGVEVPIGTHWSVGADYYFPWIWPKRDNKNCFELLAWGVEGRYWFGRNRTVFDRLQGHSVGVYGYMGYYDFERNLHGHQGEFMNVGVDYTYAMAVGKKKQVHFEFSLGFGYIYQQARKYTVIEAQGPLISDKITKKVGFFGPTKANVSLVVPIFQKVKPNDKHRGDE